MRKESAELLEDEGGTIRDDYSGRAMYGEKVYGVVFDDFREFTQALVNATYTLAEDVFSKTVDEEDAEKIMDDFRSLRTDSMGRSLIVY